MVKKKILIVLVLSFVPMLANATNGYFVHGHGMESRAMAGAGVALPHGAISGAHNPAAGVHIGNRIDFSAAFFIPQRDYESSPSAAMGMGGAFTIGPNDISSDQELFVIPNFGINKILNEKSSIGLAIYGHGGMNTVWHGGTATFDPDGPGPAPVSTLPGTYGGGTAGVDLSQGFIAPTYSRQLTDKFSVGFGPIVAIQVFRAKGVSTFAGFTESFNRSMSMPGDLSDNGRETSYGAGVNLGALYDFSDKFSIGVGYHSKIYMTEFDDYADLFAEDGDFDIPPAATIGIALKPTNKVTLAFDIQKIWYSEVASVGNDFDNLLNCPSLGGSDLESCLGGKNGPGFGWDDIEVYKIGAQVEISPTLTLRGGFSTTNQPINDSEVLFNILAPGVVEEHYTLGLTKRLSNDSRISLSFMYAPTEDVKGANPFDPTQTIELEMKQYEFGIGWSKDL